MIKKHLALRLQMVLKRFGVPQSCFGIALTWSSGKGRTLGTQRIHREFLEHLMQFYQGKDEEVADGFSSNPSTCQKGCIPKINMIKFVLGGRQECCWSWHKSSRGKDGISSHEFNWHLWRSQSVDGDHDRFCRETLWRCHRAENEGWSERLWEP